MSEGTLRLQHPLGKTLILAVVFLLSLIIAGEIVTRSDAFQHQFARPTWGSRHRQFEIQLDRLNYLIDREGSVDCIFLGNSMVMRGIDPIAFADAYHDQTGQDIRCFNFGVDAIPAVGSAALAKILVRDYQPRLLIYGTDARDYVIEPIDKDAAVFLETPWIQHRLGEFSLAGWLYDVSSLLRYRVALSRLSRFDYGRSLRSQSDNTYSSRYGFDGDPKVGEFVSLPPNQNNELGHVQYYYRILSDYEVLPENLRALEEIAALADHNTEVLILEMPVPAAYFYFFDDGVKDYQIFIDHVKNVADEHDLPFWITTAENIIPTDGWVDYSHLNSNGARIFSEWLGKQFASELADGEFNLSEMAEDTAASPGN
jgi:hypothetical protein